MDQLFIVSGQILRACLNPNMENGGFTLLYFLTDGYLDYFGQCPAAGHLATAK